MRGAWVLGFGAVVLVVLIAVLVAINVKAPMQLQLGEMTGRELLEYERMTLGDSNAAIALVRWKGPEKGQAVAARAADRGRYSWHGLLPKFLSGLDPGRQHDWVRAALGQPPSATR